MPSIVILCKTFLKGGAEKQALTLSKLLADKNFKVIIINWCGDQIDPSNLNYIKANALNYIGLDGGLVSKYRQFLKIVDNEKVSVVLSYLTLANFIAGVSKVFRRKIVTIGGIRTEQFPWYKFIFERFVHNRLNDVTVFNNFSAKSKFEKRGFNASKIRVIHNSINVPPLVNNQVPGEDISVISVCRFVGAKDFNTALYSYKQLVEKNSRKKFMYYIVGYGPLEHEIRSLVSQLSLDNNVKIVINPPDIPGILKGCDIYLSTSLFEGLSNSIMEAMVAGLPVIATNVGDIQYLVKEGHNGFIVPCRDVNLIAEKLEFLANFDEVRREFGKNSYSVIETEFSENKLIDNYLRLISEVTDSGGQRKS
jgi:glycosyltransferase involved in cell wall biosynthesis